MSLTMYDAVTVSNIPADAEAVAGYVDGHWPTFPVLKKKFPRAHKLSIAVSVTADAECLDIENGDATPDQAPAWVKRQLARGVKRPVVYSSVSEMPAVLGALRKAGISRSRVRVWTAHYTYRVHLCSSNCGLDSWCVADATQYTDRALGRSLDASIVSSNFFPAPPQPLLTKAQLRKLILRWWKNGVSWKRIKATKAWKRFRALGGK